MNTLPRPYTLVAELTYRCPLRCPYCANPTVSSPVELDTPAWLQVLEESEELGVVQVNFTGGEPVLRPDLGELIQRASTLGLYTNLITSGVPLTFARLAAFRRRGLNSVQLSLQSLEPRVADSLAGCRVLDHKLHVAQWIKRLGLPLTLNVVLHRYNLDEIPTLLAFAEDVAADRIELAHTQYLGWALHNRTALLPSLDQIERARGLIESAKARLRGRMEVVFVPTDYYSGYPRSCMGGWGRSFLVITPDGTALPCHLANTLPGLRFETVRQRPLRELWLDSEAFNRFRGEEWMSGPCHECHRRTIDFGGCRCQAFHLTGDAAATDPACALSPHHGLIKQVRQSAETGASLIQFEYRHTRLASS
jgi:PqqA peptide cyclase